MHENKTEKLLKIIAELRDPVSGCEWTKSQTSKTLLPFIIEEAKEVQDAFEKEDNENLKEELGDLLLQIVLQSRIAEVVMSVLVHKCHGDKLKDADEDSSGVFLSSLD